MKASRFAGAAILILGIASGAMAGEPKATDAEKEAVVTKYLSCLRAQAQQLDDGVSDVMSIGRAIVPMCNSELMDSATVFAQGEGGRVKRMVEENFRERAPEEAAGIVLEVRRQKRKSND
jgi:hypothetical protein